MDEDTVVSCQFTQANRLSFWIVEREHHALAYLPVKLEPLAVFQALARTFVFDVVNPAGKRECRRDLVGFEGRRVSAPDRARADLRRVAK
jgi:hypothetical protein